MRGGEILNFFFPLALIFLSAGFSKGMPPIQISMMPCFKRLYLCGLAQVVIHLLWEPEIGYSYEKCEDAKGLLTLKL